MAYRSEVAGALLRHDTGDVRVAEDEPSVRDASAKNGLVGDAMEFVTHPTGHAPLVGSEADGA